MSETTPGQKNVDNGDSSFSFLDIPVNNDNFSEYRDDSGRVSTAIKELEDAGVYVDECIANAWRDKLLLDTLEAKGVNIAEAIAFTGEFNRLAPHAFQEVVELPTGHGSHRDGRPRRAESGDRLDFERLRNYGVDPTKVLIFRVTQPSDEPVPELYWTTDFMEVRGGLSVELGKQRKTAVILIDTLDSVARNGGLMRDVNDDSGVAVRQIGLEGYDQSDAIGVISGVH